MCATHTLTHSYTSQLVHDGSLYTNFWCLLWFVCVCVCKSLMSCWRIYNPMHSVFKSAERLNHSKTHSLTPRSIHLSTMNSVFDGGVVVAGDRRRAMGGRKRTTLKAPNDTQIKPQSFRKIAIVDCILYCFWRVSAHCRCCCLCCNNLCLPDVGIHSNECSRVR